MKEEQKNQSSISEEMNVKPAGWKKFFKRKWFFPAIYLGLAALILALITWYQNPNDFEITTEDLGFDTISQESTDPKMSDYLVDEQREEALPVTAGTESMAWPVAQDEEVQVVLGFFDDNATEEEQMAAMVEYDRAYHPHQGLDLSRPDGKTFDVLAALTGTVIAADKDPLVGYFVEIEHENGLVTVYQSLENIEVAEGDTVKQGDLLGQAGRNVFEKDLGIHLHFEVRENDVAVNPDQYLAKVDTQQ
ncbi:M23 family metallopeptidase [Caldalkalibacillus mannanilyticus]|uniref:M23 family metallopeptidase n=1 Tax=Caldalkalibacillus mannanilyticus TaxID=1418 RepID=UPI00046831BB|nr:M23 family metallopeptidase [Caldalkalibacillus mannanilyticus]